LGQTVRFVGTTPDFVAYSLLFGILDTFAAEQVREEAKARVVAYVNALPPGAARLRANIATVLAGVPGLVFLESAPYGLEPGSPGDADVVPASKSTIYRTRPDLVTFA
jgi:hypothetical protein